MSFNTFGKIFRFTTWGESSWPSNWLCYRWLSPNIPISEKDIQIDMDRRRPGQSKFTTQRKEADKVIILSGVFEGKTTGTPISILIHNEDKKSRDYESIKINLDQDMLILLTLKSMELEISGVEEDNQLEKQLVELQQELLLK